MSLALQQFSGGGYLTTKDELKFGMNFYLTVQFRVNSADLATGGVLFVVISSVPIICTVTPDVLMCQVGVPNSEHINFAIRHNFLDFEWHNVALLRSADVWKFALDGDTTDRTESIPTLADSRLCLGGMPSVPVEHLLNNVCVASVQVNSRKFVNLADFTISGFFTGHKCPILFSDDAVLEELSIPSTALKCDRACDIKFKNRATLSTPFSDITCCSSGTLDGGMSCDIGPSMKGQSAVVAMQTTPNNPNSVQCIYDRNKIDSIGQTSAAIKMFGDKNEVTDAFCQSSTTTCPSFLRTGCSRFFSTKDDGAFCRSRFNKLTAEEQDVWMSNYCSRNNTDDCKCVNRSKSDDYRQLKQGNPFSDACWFIPCSNKDNFFVPSEFNKSIDCPSNICQIVYDISQQHHVDIDHNKNDISCNFSGSGFGPDPSTTWFYVALICLSALLLAVYAIK